MSDIDYQAKYLETKLKRDEATRQMQKILDEYALSVCPYGIRNIISFKEGPLHYRNWTITRIKGIFIKEKLHYVLELRIIKTNGTMGKISENVRDDSLDFYGIKVESESLFNIKEDD